jgi:hypothetical protein
VVTRSSLEAKMYLLIDPPVNPFSPSDEIVAWIAELEELAQRPEYQEKAPREQIRSSMSQARRWLRTSKRLDVAESAQAREAVPHPPA